jgi:alkylation response protein AidB-like acyl-CoA dehydrogenase
MDNPDPSDAENPTAENPTADCDVTVEVFGEQAAKWLVGHATRRTTVTDGAKPFSVAVFHSLAHADEADLLATLQAWHQLKATAGYHAITWPTQFGGLGLSKEHAKVFARLERDYNQPEMHETFSVTTGLIAPTVAQYGTPKQQQRHVASFLSAAELCCQLFSEPGAGSDLASLSCRAEPDGDQWVINGQKVWSSGAQFSQWGELIARSDVHAPKHKGMTAFLLPMDLPGIEVRPIKQMSGGTSFNEVFFTDVRVPDSMRLGAVGEGWKVALTTLGFERDHSGGGSGSHVGGSWSQMLSTAQMLGRTGEPAIRAALTDVYVHSRIESLVNRRAADIRRSGGTPGPEGSLGKVLWTQGMSKISDAASLILGARLVADTGEWGTYAWGEHVLGAPGYRIAGGSDEIQRNIIGERVLGLPVEPRVTTVPSVSHP